MHMLHRGLRILFHLSFKHFKLTWLGLGLILLLALTQLHKLKFLVMLSDLLDQDFQTYPQFQKLNTDFDEENQSSVFIRNQDKPITFQQHCLLIRWLTKVHLGQTQIARIYSSYGYREILEEKDGFSFRPVLVQDCEKRELGTAELSQQLQKLAQSPSGVVLTNKRKDDVFASFYLRNLPEKGMFGSFDTTAYESLQASFRDQVLSKEPSLKATWVGIGTYQYYLQKAYEQMNFLNIITVVFALLGFRFFFGRWKSGMIFLATYFISLTIIYGFMAFMGFPVDSLSAAMPIMLLIATLEDYIYFIVLYHRQRSIVSSFQKIMVPGFYTSLSTSIGFLTLYLSDLAIIRRFGLICSVGAMIEWFMIYLTLPKILVLLKRRSNGFTLAEIPEQIQHLSQAVARLKLPRWCTFLALIPFVYVLFQYRGNLSIKDSPEAVFPKSHIVTKSTEELLKQRNWKSEVSLIFPQPLSEDRRNEVIEDIMRTIPEFVANEGFQETKTHLLLPVANPSRKKLARSLMDSSPISERWIARDSGTERVLLFSQTTDVVRVSKMRKEVSAICGEDCYLANILVSYSEFGLKILDTLTDSFGMSMIDISLLILLLCLFMNVKDVIPLILSSLWGPVTLISIFLFFDIGIYFATSVVMSVLVGISGDNGLHFLFAKGKNKSLEDGIDEMGLASVLTMVLMFILCSSFLFSDFEGVRKIGLMMMSGFVLGLIGDLVVLRGLLSKI